MNHQLYKYMKMNMNKNNGINELYRTFWINTLNQFKESNEENGQYFWLQKVNDNYVIFHHGVNGLVKQYIKMSDEEKDIVINKLTNDGFTVTTTENNSILLTISKKDIINYIENNQTDEKTNSIKPIITPFTETRRRK